ncbi:MAG: L,D-transpeptidase family protein [Succinivibrionaceae bacterium]|nr:L,D-transpeptidase family protein [Succinivibrionaceae bacterium]
MLPAQALTTAQEFLFSRAVSSAVEYDREFDYQRLGKVDGLRIFPEGYRPRKNLVDEVVVNKAHHQMFLMKKGKVVKSYWIALSNRPVGKKQFQGDRRTPEGRYTLDYIKEHSSFYKAFHISYPNRADIAFARSQGRQPGGLIMVHGQPPSKSGYHDSVQRSDWTNGCIAILNPEMDEFLSLVDPGTPITINP